jgi:hypothetical protein
MRQGLRNERLVALFILAWFAFHPPIITLFGANAMVLGLPVLYFYLFAAWLAVIVLVRVILRGSDSLEPDLPAEPAPRHEREG